MAALFFLAVKRGPHSPRLILEKGASTSAANFPVVSMHMTVPLPALSERLWMPATVIIERVTLARPGA